MRTVTRRMVCKLEAQPGPRVICGAGAGAVAAGAMSWLSGLIQAEDTVEKLHAELLAPYVSGCPRGL